MLVAQTTLLEIACTGSFVLSFFEGPLKTGFTVVSNPMSRINAFLQNTKSNSGITYWWCTVRNSHCKCPAMVKQIGRTFTRGKWKHEHLVGLNKSSVVSATGAKRKERLVC